MRGNKLIMRAALFTLLFYLLAADLPAAAPALEFSGTFTNLTYHDESGDLSGWEVMLIPQADGSYFALVQVAKGETPLILTGRASAISGSIRITVEGKPPLAGTYTGTFSGSLLLLKTPSGSIERLRRGRSYWD
jgi:hypothetical protein